MKIKLKMERVSVPFLFYNYYVDYGVDVGVFVGVGVDVGHTVGKLLSHFHLISISQIFEATHLFPSLTCNCIVRDSPEKMLSLGNFKNV